MSLTLRRAITESVEAFRVHEQDHRGVDLMHRWEQRDPVRPVLLADAERLRAAQRCARGALP